MSSTEVLFAPLDALHPEIELTVPGGPRRHIIGWAVLPVLAVFNGFVRDSTYGQNMEAELSHSISVLPLLILILAWAAFLGRRWPLANRGTAIRVGGIWLALTLVFEFGLGSLQGMTMSAMLAEYDITRGRLWPLVPLITALAPELMRRLVGGDASSAG